MSEKNLVKSILEGEAAPRMGIGGNVHLGIFGEENANLTGEQKFCSLGRMLVKNPPEYPGQAYLTAHNARGSDITSYRLWTKYPSNLSMGHANWDDETALAELVLESKSDIKIHDSITGHSRLQPGTCRIETFLPYQIVRTIDAPLGSERNVQDLYQETRIYRISRNPV